ncbi:hypothetical protein ACWD4T_34350, partial [Streptomyces umbrinus]
VNNPQMVELQKLTAAHFTKETGIKVNFTVLPDTEYHQNQHDRAQDLGPSGHALQGRRHVAVLLPPS